MCIQKTTEIIQEFGAFENKSCIVLSLVYGECCNSSCLYSVGFIPFNRNLNMNVSYLLVKMYSPQEDKVTSMNIFLRISKLAGF